MFTPPLYLAPKSNKYNESSDFWLMGCVFYEVLCGERPTRDMDTDTQLSFMTRNIETDCLTPMEPDCESFLRGMLKIKQNERFTWTQILDHPYIVKDYNVEVKSLLTLSQKKVFRCLLRSGDGKPLRREQIIENAKTLELPNKLFNLLIKEWF